MPRREIVHLCAEDTPYPMQSPFESAQRRSTVAENVRVRVALADGSIGYGEAAPAAYVTGESPQSVQSAVTEISSALYGQDAERTARWSGILQEALATQPTARSAIEMALFDALTRAWGIPLWIYFGGAAPTVRTDLTIPIASAEQAGDIAREAAGKGFRSLKIKVGGPNLDEDLERVLAVSAAAPHAGLRLDANQGFSVDAAIAFLRACERHGVNVEFLEQPVPRDEWGALAEVARRSSVPVIADEAVVDAAAALRVAATGAAHGINIKLAKSGFVGALQIISIARAAKLKLMLGCMLESLLGTGGALHLACGTGAFDYLDLDSHMLIGLPPAERPFSQSGDELTVHRTAPGIGWES